MKSKWITLLEDIRWTYTNPPHSPLYGLLSVVRLLLWHGLLKRLNEYSIGKFNGMHFLYDSESDGGAMSYIVPEDDFRLHSVLKVLSKNSVYFDVGANVGTKVLLAAQKGAFIHAFEPTERTFSNLVINVMLNNFQSQCFLHQKAISNTNGSVRFYSDLNGISLTNSIKTDFNKKFFTEVPCLTLDSYVKSSAVTKVDLIKIDVEGAELLVFKGATQVLKKQILKAIFWESNQQAELSERLQTMALLSRHQYQHFGVDVDHRTVSLVPWDNHHDCLSLLPSEIKKFKKVFSSSKL